MKKTFIKECPVDALRTCVFIYLLYLKKQYRVSEKITLWILRHVWLLTIKFLIILSSTKDCSYTEGNKNQTNFVAKKWPPARFWAHNALTGHSSFNSSMFYWTNCLHFPCVCCNRTQMTSQRVKCRKGVRRWSGVAWLLIFTRCRWRLL